MSQGAAMANEPLSFFDGSYTRMHSVARPELEALQLDAMQLRFAEMREEIAVLKRFADRQEVHRIDALDDVTPLLFDHAVYKSYPSRLITTRRFDQLTTWLGRLTTCDLGGLDTADCRSLDDWLDLLDAHTSLAVSHSSGTTGTLSFLPLGKAELETYVTLMAAIFTQSFGSDGDFRDAPAIDVIFPFFRHGGQRAFRHNAASEKMLTGGPERLHALLDARASTDVMHFAGQLRAATAKGRAHAIEVDPALLARKAEFDALNAEMPALVEQFLERKADELAGRPVLMAAPWSLIHRMAESGLAAGHRHVFAPESTIIAAGGTKGWEPPADWQERTLEYFGASELRFLYGMSEISLAARLCEYRKYHLNPWIVPFVLDPDSGAVLPRSGTRTGRAAYFDVLPQTRWGGFVTGDEITIHWDDPCPCGQVAVYCDESIQRFSDTRGGEDKITCVATADAHQQALDYLNSFDFGSGL